MYSYFINPSKHTRIRVYTASLEHMLASLTEYGFILVTYDEYVRFGSK